MTWLDSGVQRPGHSRPTRSNLLNTISPELREQSQWNLLGIASSPYWPGSILEVKGQGYSRSNYVVAKASMSTLECRGPSSRVLLLISGKAFSHHHHLCFKSHFPAECGLAGFFPRVFFLHFFLKGTFGDKWHSFYRLCSVFLVSANQ